MFADHTGKIIADSVLDILNNWELSTEKLVAFTTDSGSNVVAAFNTLNLLWISCFGHNFDLAIKTSLNISPILQALAWYHSVELFNHSWKGTRGLWQKQQLLDLLQHKLKCDVARGGGPCTYEMVFHIVEQKQALNSVLAEDRKNWYKMPSDAEFSALEMTVEVLKPFIVPDRCSVREEGSDYISCNSSA